MLTTSQPTELAARLRLTLTRAARRLRQESGAGLTPSQASALATVERHGPLAPSALAERERVQRPTAARILGRMEEEGLVTRAPDPADGRSSRVAITPAGSALLQEARAHKTAFLAGRLEALDAADLATLQRAVELLERLLEAEG